MQTTHYASCLGDCGQGNKDCPHPGKCFFAPQAAAEAASELLAERDDDRDDFGMWRGMAVAVGVTAAMIVVGLVIAEVAR